MGSISVSEKTKAEWDELKPDDLTHDEFAEEVIAAYRRDNGEIVDVDSLVDGINERVVSNIEIAVYRATKEALEK